MLEETETHDQFLLATKLAFPPVRSNVVLRPRLAHKVQVALQGPLTLLTASAGFGKTTLLCTVLQHYQWPAVWLSLESNDDDLTRFWSYIFAALENLQPNISKGARTLLQGFRQPAIETILTMLLNRLVLLEQDSILVLDDYYTITSSSIHSSLAFFWNTCRLACMLSSPHVLIRYCPSLAGVLAGC